MLKPRSSIKKNPNWKVIIYQPSPINNTLSTLSWQSPSPNFYQQVTDKFHFQPIIRTYLKPSTGNDSDQVTGWLGVVVVVTWGRRNHQKHALTDTTWWARTWLHSLRSPITPHSDWSMKLSPRRVPTTTTATSHTLITGFLLMSSIWSIRCGRSPGHGYGVVIPSRLSHVHSTRSIPPIFLSTSDSSSFNYFKKSDNLL